MAVLSLGEVPALKKLMEEMGYVIHMHNACGGQSFDIDPIDKEQKTVSDAAAQAIERFFSMRGMKVYFQDESRRNFVAR